MPNINFPTSPALNDQYSFQGKTWTYNGVAWVLTSSPTSVRLDSAYGHANAAFAYANTISGGAAIDNVARLQANSSYIHANAAFDKANTSSGSANSFGVIYTANNNTFANAETSNAQVNFVGESGVFVFANSITKTITVAGTPGAQGLTVDYGFVADPIYYSIDYGSLA